VAERRGAHYRWRVAVVQRHLVWIALVGPLLIAAVLPGLAFEMALFAGTAKLASTSAMGWNALAVLAAFAFGVVAHEGAHAFVAEAVGLRVVSVRLGQGPVLWQRSFGRVAIVLRAVPFTGLTAFVAPSARWLRPRLMATIAAGPLMNAALAAACLPLVQDGTILTGLALRPAPALAFVVANAALFLVATIPLPAVWGSAASDSWNFVATPFRPASKLAALVNAHAAWHAARTVPKLAASGKVAEAQALVDDALARDPASALARVAQTDLLVLTQRWFHAAAALRALLSDTQVQRVLAQARAALANNLAVSDLHLDGPTVLEEADRCSSEALAANPHTPSIAGTRGAVLVARGRLAEAEPLLRRAFDRNPLAAQRAVHACWLGILHAKRGDLAGAERWLGTARQLSPTCSLLVRDAARTGLEAVKAALDAGAPDAALVWLQLWGCPAEACARAGAVTWLDGLVLLDADETAAREKLTAGFDAGLAAPTIQACVNAGRPEHGARLFDAFADRLEAQSEESLAQRLFYDGEFEFCARVSAHLFGRSKKPEAAYNVACALARRGDAEGALDWIGRAVEAGYRNTGQLVADEDLASLRGRPAFAGIVERLQIEAPPSCPREAALEAAPLKTA
jgi:tetratricopeptide (TPR) repeat protein